MTFKNLSISVSFAVFTLYAALILSLFYFYDGAIFLDTLRSPRTLFSIRLSLFTATVSTIIAVIVAIPSAYALSRYRFIGRQLIDTMLELPMIVSPVALG
ncbi:MAG: transporter permease, partial [Deltaproteobacteria bacterium]|nr:transporter permease [Deltaproteobacteria bacterium]